MRNTVVLVLLAGHSSLASWPVRAAAQEEYKHESQYQGTRLAGGVLLCTADREVVAGFYNTVGSGGTRRLISVSQPIKTAAWRIKLGQKVATVRAFSGMQQFDTPYDFNVERTSAGLLLTSRRLSGHSPEIITIDPATSSFVYSNHHVNPMLNRAAIWYGSCRPDPRRK